MQQDRYDNLIQLIQSSSILSLRERSEWSALLELMNDKQLNELEKILLAAQEQDEAAQQPAVQPVQPARPAPAPIKTVTPESLLHNLQPAKPTRPLEDIRRNNTFTKIKDVLAEKELPPGHPGPLQELELLKPQLPAQPAPAVRPSPLPARPAPPVAPSPKPKPGLEPSVDLSKLLAKKLANQDGLMPRPLPRPPVAPKVPIKTSVNTQVQGEGRSLGVELDKVRGLEQAEKVFQPAQKPATAHREHFYEKPNITSLQSLAGLTYDNFAASKSRELFEQLGRLIKQYGFHDVRNYLEQSPLYQVYVDTGAKVLAGQADFVQEWEGLMSQEDFETFADLLIQMHTV